MDTSTRHATQSSNASPGHRSNPSQESSWQRTVLLALVVIAVSIVVVFAARFNVSARGGASPLLTAATNPALAISTAFASMAFALVIALALAKPCNAVVSLFALGCAFAAYAMQTGTVSDFIFLGSSFKGAATETILWSVFIALSAMLAFRVGGALVDVPAHDRDGKFVGELAHKRALLSLISGAVAIPVLLLSMVGPSKGQAIGACALAGIATAVVGRMLAPRAQPILLFAMPALAIGLAQLALAMSMTKFPVDAFVHATLSPILIPMPMDVAAGSLIGVAIGLGWSKGLVKQEPTSLRD